MTPDKIIEELNEQSYSLRSWAKKKKYSYSTVKNTLHRHAESTTPPRGKIAQRILADLGETLGHAIQPEEQNDA